MFICFVFESISLFQSTVHVVCRHLYICNRENLRALKRLNGGSDERRSLERENRVIFELDHPNIVKYYDSFVDDFDLFLVTEFCEVFVNIFALC